MDQLALSRFGDGTSSRGGTSVGAAPAGSWEVIPRGRHRGAAEVAAAAAISAARVIRVPLERLRATA